MAVDDGIVNVVAVAASAAITFQPAVGVEVLILQAQIGSAAGVQLAHTVGIYDGVRLSGYTDITTAVVTGTSALRMFITNTDYLRYLTDVTARDFSYSGVQIK